MTAPSASEDLKDFVCDPGACLVFSRTYKTPIGILIPFLAAERDCVPGFSAARKSRLLFGRDQISASGHQPAARLFLRGGKSPLIFSILHHMRGGFLGGQAGVGSWSDISEGAIQSGGGGGALREKEGTRAF